MGGFGNKQKDGKRVLDSPVLDFHFHQSQIKSNHICLCQMDQISEITTKMSQIS
jgi:hypothetical protein